LQALLLDPDQVSLVHRTIWELFPELIGQEQDLEALRNQPEAILHIDRIFRPTLHGDSGYVSLSVKAYEDGWLVAIRNTTHSGRNEQQIVQQRNESDLLSRELEKARAQLDNLLRTFVPSAVVDDLLKTSKVALGGQIRFVTILFADLRGYTAWAEKRTPQEAIASLNELLSSAFEILHENGATMNQVMGDGFMSIFNAPIEQPRHAILALESAKQIAGLPGLDECVRFGVGVYSGFAMVGNVGSARAMNYSAIGTTTNVAYRLQQLAGPGEALFGDKTKELAGAHFAHVAHGCFEAKGVSAPLTVYRLV
jgi:class 3 adenylate cyclase